MGFAVAAAVAEEGCAFGCVNPSVRLSREARLPPAIPLRANEVSVRGLIIMIHADTNPGPGRSERPRRRLKVFESQYNR